MKLKSILNVYYDKELKMDIVKGKIINEVYEARGAELTEERAKVLVAAGVATILEEDPITIDQKDIVDPGEVNKEEVASVEAPEVIIEDNKENNKEVVTSTNEIKEDLKGESVEAPKKRKNKNVENAEKPVEKLEEKSEEK